MPENLYDDRYLAGIRYFNECEFFEAHEVGEDLWQDFQGPSRGFYQGLIQVAVCLHHFGNGNIRGAKKLYESSRYKYLEPYRPQHLGLNLDQFLEQLANCCAEILASEDEYPQVELDPEKLPEHDLCHCLISRKYRQKTPRRGSIFYIGSFVSKPTAPIIEPGNFPEYHIR